MKSDMITTAHTYIFRTATIPRAATRTMDTHTSTTLHSYASVSECDDSKGEMLKLQRCFQGAGLADTENCLTIRYSMFDSAFIIQSLGTRSRFIQYSLSVELTFTCCSQSIHLDN